MSSQLERALAALRRAKERIVELERAANTPIAIAGVGLRFPGGVRDPEGLWEVLTSGRDVFTETPPDRYDLEPIYHPERGVPGRTHCRTGGYLQELDRFDARFFGISAREAEAMDPQQRILLEVSWEALERAGYSRERLQGSRTGVFVGVSNNDYALRFLHPEAVERLDLYFGTGNAFSGASGRLSYFLGLRGPSVTLDTACSSSLVAVHAACRSLRAGECDQAVAAGVNVILAPSPTIYLSRLGFLSRSGQVRAFDAEADGFVRSEGCGVLVLRRLEDARAAGDPVLAVIRGSAVNHNGQGNGIAAPSRAAQEAVIREALQAAGVAPADVGYVEAFGSATSLGDLVELTALDAVLGAREKALAVGAVKTNLGHAEAAAGMASLIKAALCLKKRRLVPNRHFDNPSPAIPWADLAVRVPVREEDFEATVRIAGVSAFGFTGTNAHVVLEEAPELRSSSEEVEPALLVLSAVTPEALQVRARELAARLERSPELSLDDVAFTLGAGRTHFDQRAALIASSRAQLIEDLLALGRGERPLSSKTGVARRHRHAALEPSDDARALERWRSWGVELEAGGDADLLVPAVSDRPAMLEALAELYVAGIDPDWRAVHAGGARRIVDLPTYPFERERHWVDRFASPAPRSVSPPAFDRPLLLAATPAERERLLTAQLAAATGARADADRDLSELGLDSLGAVDLIRVVQRDLKLQLYPSELFEHRTVRALARHLAGELDRTHPQTACSEPPPAAAAEARVRLRRLSQGTLSGVTASTRLPGAVFILSCPRAGSTLLRVMLAGHEALFAPPELHLLPFENLADRHAKLSGDLLTLGLSHALLGLGLSEEEARVQVDSWVARAAATHEAYARLLELAAPRILIDKSPSYAFDRATLERAEQLFDRPRYIHLTRHPYPVIESFARMRMGHLVGAAELDPHVVAEEVWTTANQNIRDFFRDVAPERRQTLAYEDLVAHPERAMRALSDFLGVDYDPRMLQPYAGEAHRMVPPAELAFIGDPGFAAHKTIEPELGERWRTLELPYRLSAETRALAQALGYDEPRSRPRRPNLDLEAEAVLPADIQPAPASASAELRAIFLTGATGHLGPSLLAALLRETDAQLHCLVRAASPSEALARIHRALAAIGAWDASFARRIVPVPGDLAAPNLGLDGAAFDALAGELDAIYHNGALVNFAQTWHQLRGPNVAGTLEVLRLACARRSKYLHHISTKGIFSPDSYPAGARILEDDPVRPLAGASLGYQQTKWVAERLVVQARERGLPVAIYRPGRIGGETGKGRLPETDFVHRLIQGCVELGAIPALDVGFEMMPVDFVSRAIVHISRRRDSLGRAFHLMNTDPLSVGELAVELRRAGYPLSVLPYAEWRAALLERSARDTGGPLAPLLSMFTVEPPRRIDDRSFDTRNTRSALEGSGLIAAPVGEQLAESLAAMIQDGHLHRAR